MNTDNERSYEARQRHKTSDEAATPASDQVTTEELDLSFLSVTVLYDPTSWIVHFLKPSGGKLTESFCAKKTKSLLRMFHCNQERRFARMVRLLQSIRNALKQLDVVIKIPSDLIEQARLAKTILSEVPPRQIASQANQLFSQLQIWADNSLGVVVMHETQNTPMTVVVEEMVQLSTLEHQLDQCGTKDGDGSDGDELPPVAMHNAVFSSNDYPREPIPNFVAEGRMYLDGFNFLRILAKHGSYFQWSTVEWHIELRGHTCDEIWMWFCCLLPEVQCNFQAFVRSFKERWMDDPCPASIRYYHAQQQQDEYIEAFFTRLCYYAQNAGINVRTQWHGVFNHFLCCLNIESDQLIGSMHFDTNESFSQLLADRRVRQYLMSAYSSWSNDLPPVTQIKGTATTVPVPNHSISVSCQTDCASIGVPFRSTSPIFLRSGQTRVIPICMNWNHESTTFWTNRGPQWVATLLYDDANQPSAIRVTNTSKNRVILGSQVLLGQSLDPGHEPVSATMVMVNSRAYEERQLEVEKNRHTRRYLAKTSEKPLRPVIFNCSDFHVAAIWKRVATNMHSAIGDTSNEICATSIEHNCFEDIELEGLLNEALAEFSDDELSLPNMSITPSQSIPIPIPPPAEPPPAAQCGSKNTSTYNAVSILHCQGGLLLL